jgi:hypothetical protein
METNVSAQLDRLLALYKKLDVHVELQEGSGETEIAHVEEETGLVLPSELHEMHRLTNGASKHFLEGSDRLVRFAVGEDEPQRLSFCGLDEGRRTWGTLYLEDTDTYGRVGNTDLFLIADVLGGQESVYINANPRKSDAYGHVFALDFFLNLSIVASSFIEFFRDSNSILAEMADEDIEYFREWMLR